MTTKPEPTPKENHPYTKSYGDGSPRGCCSICGKGRNAHD